MSRPYRERDQGQVLELVLAYRLATSVRVYPTIWRVRLLLSSRVWEPERDTRVWEDAAGRVVGFAMLWRRRRDDAYLVLDHFVRLGDDEPALIDDILKWGKERAREIAARDRGLLRLFAGELALESYSRVDFGAHGFSAAADDSGRHNVYFVRSLAAVPEAGLLPGYTVRPLRGLAELEHYERVYGFSRVSAEHRQAMIESGEYGCLAVVNPAGAFVGYCEYSIGRAEWERGAERVGWIDYVGTMEGERQKGLGEAVLLVALDNLRDWGAEAAMLVTISDNAPAQRLYRKVGFEPAQVSEPRRYEMQVEYREVV